MNSDEEYCEPLSLLTISDIPCLENTDLRDDMTLAKVIDES